MYRNSYNGKGRRPRYKNSISRTSYVDRSSVTGLKLARAAVFVLMIALIVGMIIVGSAMFKNDAPERQSAKVENAAQSDERELLRVVNKTHPLDKDYVPALAEVGGVFVNKLAEEPLKLLLEDAERNGVKLGAESGYVSYGDQNKLYKKALKYYMENENLSEVKAQAKCEAVIPQAGRSEAQTGLLISFKTDKGEFKGSKAERWLSENCVDFGFVKRYASDKENVTSMKENPMAYRYVGVQTAEIMRSLNKSLDEYSVYINSR